MALIQSNYEAVADRIRPGDVIAFSSRGWFASITKRVTRSAVSHNGVAFAPGVMIESVAPKGVQRRNLADVMAGFDGEAWWLPLSPVSRSRLDEPAMTAFLRASIGKRYDYLQAAGSGLDWLGNAIFRVGENLERLFCSELAAAGHEAGGLYSLNASEVTPGDLASFAIYDATYYQLKGRTREIRGYNRITPDGFGE